MGVTLAKVRNVIKALNMCVNVLSSSQKVFLDSRDFPLKESCESEYENGVLESSWTGLLAQINANLFNFPTSAVPSSNEDMIDFSSASCDAWSPQPNGLALSMTTNKT